MFNSRELEVISNEYRVELRNQNSKLKKVWGFFLGLVLAIIILFIVLFPNQFDKGGTAWILPTYGGACLLVTIIGFIVSFSYVSEKPAFNYLYPKVIEKMNLDDGTFMQYDSYVKKDNQFNKDGGLFTRMASVRVRRKIEGYTSNQMKYEIRDCIMTTSNGKSQQTHFDGTYFVLYKPMNTSVQIRSNGSPHLKGTKFSRLKEEESFKVYKEQETYKSSMDEHLIRKLNDLKLNENIKRVYLGTIDQELHLAIWYKKHPLRKVKQLNIQELNRIESVLREEKNLIAEFSEIGFF